MASIKQPAYLLAGILVALLLGLAAASVWRPADEESPSAVSADHEIDRSLADPVIDLQKEGPFLDGRSVTLEEAKSASGIPLPTPPETAVTGPLASIWTSESGRVAYVWESDLRLYVDRIALGPAEVAPIWEQKAQDRQQPFRIVEVSGAEALGVEGVDALTPSSLTFFGGGDALQFVGPKQTLAQLVALAEGLTFE